MVTVIEISFDPPLEEGKPGIQKYPLNSYLLNNVKDNRRFSSLKTVKTVHGFIDPY